MKRAYTGNLGLPPTGRSSGKRYRVHRGLGSSLFPERPERCALDLPMGEVVCTHSSWVPRSRILPSAKLGRAYLEYQRRVPMFVLDSPNLHYRLSYLTKGDLVAHESSDNILAVNDDMAPGKDARGDPTGKRRQKRDSGQVADYRREGDIAGVEESQANISERCYGQSAEH